MKIAFAIFLFVHALAHGVGFLTVSGLVQNPDQPSDPTFLLGSLPPEHQVFKVMAALWLIALAGFAGAGIGVITGSGWAFSATVTATFLSTGLSVIWLRAAPFGLIANLIVLAALVMPWISNRVFPL